MSATAIQPLSDRQLETELDTQQGELRRLRERLASEQRKFSGAVAERGRVIEAIERGGDRQTELARAKQEVETLEIRIGGLQKNVAPVEARIHELTAELQRRQAAAAKAAREASLRDRAEKLRLHLLRIRETVALLCTGDLFTAEQERAMIASEFADIGGIETARALGEILFKPPHPSGALHNSEVHLAAFAKAGLVPFGFEIVTHALRSTVQGAPPTQGFSLRPAPALRLTILPMGPRAS